MHPGQQHRRNTIPTSLPEHDRVDVVGDGEVDIAVRPVVTTRPVAEQPGAADQGFQPGLGGHRVPNRPYAQVGEHARQAPEPMPPPAERAPDRGAAVRR